MNLKKSRVLVILGAGSVVAGNFIIEKKSLHERYYDEVILVYHRTLPTLGLPFRVVQGNVSDPPFMKSLFQSIEKSSSIDVINCVIDKHSTYSMKQSIKESSRALVSLSLNDKRVRIISISTTAILSPVLYRSGYANAKLNEFRTFQHLRSVSLLCPQIIQASSQKLAYSRQREKLTIDPTTLSNVLFYICETPTLEGVLMIERLLLTKLPASGNYHASPLKKIHTLLAAGKYWALSPKTRHHSERILTYTLLDLTPDILEQKLDHHLVPAALVRRFEKLFKCKIVTVEGAML